MGGEGGGRERGRAAEVGVEEEQCEMERIDGAFSYFNREVAVLQGKTGCGVLGKFSC